MIERIYLYLLISIFTAAATITLFPRAGIAQQTLEDFEDRYHSDFHQFRTVFESGVAESRASFDRYQERVNREYQTFKQAMIQKWGAFDERTKKRWVEYKDSGDVKVMVDFETGRATVAMITDNRQGASQAKKNMEKQVVEAIEARGTQWGVPLQNLPNNAVTKEPVLQGQINKKADETDKQYAGRVVKKNMKTKKVEGGDGQVRTVVYVNFNLAPDHIRVRAQKVQDHVYRYAQSYTLNPSLVFAIIHTESFFNPLAVSPSNAYGLMQLIPETGGRDAYRAVFKKDGIPTKQFLFNPDNNVRLGCAYLHLIRNRYIQNVGSDLTNQYLMIAAYNAGVGNLARTFTGGTSTNMTAALEKIKRMTPEQNYNHLLQHLPSADNRDYLNKVTERTRMYESMKR